jgi:hypothetical protein
MEFAGVIKFLIILAGGFAIPISAYAAVMATRSIWGRPRTPAGGDWQEELEQLKARVSDLESQAARLVEVEERLDFAERLLAQRREVERLPGP